jgi:hypothetical protein
MRLFNCVNEASNILCKQLEAHFVASDSLNLSHDKTRSLMLLAYLKHGQD